MIKAYTIGIEIKGPTKTIAAELETLVNEIINEAYQKIDDLTKQIKIGATLSCDKPEVPSA